MLSATEAAASQRGQQFKRVVRAAAALQGIYDDVSLGDAVGVNRGAVMGWWRGSQPSPSTLRELALATGLSIEELTAFAYYEGAPPRLPEPGSAVASGVEEGIRRDQERQPGEAAPARAPSPVRPPRDTGSGSG